MARTISVRVDGDVETRLGELSKGQNTSDAIRGLIKAAPTRKPFQEMGTSTSSRWGGMTRDEGLRELRGETGRRKYQEMRRNNAVINAIFFAIETYLRGVAFYAESVSDSPEDRGAGEFLDQALHDMSFSFDDEMLFILVMMEQGFSALEIVYKLRRGRNPGRYGGIKNPAQSQYDDGMVAWRKWSPRPATSLVAGDEFEMDENGGLQGINQLVGKKLQKMTIPIENVLLFRTTPAPSNSPFGVSLLRGLYQSYYYSTNIAQVEAIGVERDLAGLPVVYLGTGTTTTGTNSDYDQAKALVENIRNDEQAGVVIPNVKMGMGEGGEGILLELLSTGGARAFNTSEIINRWDKRMALTVMAQFIMLGMESVGSYSLARTQGDVFSVAIDAWASSIAATISRHAVPRLFEMNPKFASLEQLPTVVHSDVGVPNLEAMSKYVNALVGAQVLTPDAAIEKHLREMAGLPPMSDEIEVRDRTVEVDVDDEIEPDEDIPVEKDWLPKRYAKWLSIVAPKLAEAAPEQRAGLLKSSIDALAQLISQPAPDIDYDGLGEHEHDARDGLLKAAARKLANVLLTKDVETLDILRAGMSLLKRFDTMRPQEEQAVNKADKMWRDRVVADILKLED